MCAAPSRSGIFFAGIAQLVEQLICNQQVVGSNPTAGSITISRCRLARLADRLSIGAHRDSLRHSFPLGV
jgi:hypothetical protein